MKVVIIGKSGQLANELLAEIPQGVTYLSLGRHDVDITSYRDLSAKIVPFKPNVIINASAYSAVDKAETEEEFYFQITIDLCQSPFLEIVPPTN